MGKNYLKKFILVIIVLALLISSGGIGLFPSSSYGLTFSEDFSTNTFKDSANTTADWNTGLGKLRLPATSNWTKADGVTPGYDNISNNIGDSGSPQIVLDSSQRPNIVWVDNTTGNGDIFFSKWNGTAWTKADGSTPGYDNVSNNSGDSWGSKNCP